MRAVRPAAMALFFLVVLMALISPRQAVAGVAEIPGTEDASQAAIDDILTETALVLVSGAAAIVGLMRGRL